jgi:hypothetical protein
MKNYMILSAILISSLASAADGVVLAGSWSGSPDCEIKFLQDDGKDVLAVCDNDRFHHRISGIYTSGLIIIGKTARLNIKTKCKTSVDSAIRIIDSDNLEYLQAGWNGCGISTSSITQIWKRNK